MLKRVISLVLCSVLIFSVVCSSAFADDSNNYDTCTHEWEQPLDHWYGIPIPGTDITFGVDVERCTKCGLYKHIADLLVLKSTYYSLLPPHIDGIIPSELITYWLNYWYNTFGNNANADKMDSTNAGANIPAAGGRNPKGYGDEGKASVSPNGVELIWVEPFGLAISGSTGFSTSDPSTLFAGSSPSGTNFSGNKNVFACAVYEFTAPVSGLYYVGSSFNPYDYGTVEFFSSSSAKWIVLDGLRSYTSSYFFSKSLNKGDSCYFYFRFGNPIANAPFRANLLNLHIAVEPLGDSSITTTNNITINNNTWNGNIYTDNSTNLTYIYPEYTTINENNETVTNISTNPIIYNNETKQYYTYDQTTKNYYYITYNSDPAPSPTPTPAPTDKPGGSISTPETGKPGNSSGSSWWDKLLSKIGDAIIDGLLGAVSAVLKLIFKLFSTILSWIIWAVSRVFDLLPFLPSGLGGLLVGGVVVCFVIGIIKFIRG